MTSFGRLPQPQCRLSKWWDTHTRFASGVFRNPNFVWISSCGCTISSQSDITAAGDIMCAAYACASPAKRGILSHFPTYIKKSILKDSSWRACAGMLAHIRVHLRVTRSLTHVIIQNMYFIYYITHKQFKLFKNIAYICINIQNCIAQENRHNRTYVWTSYI